MGYKLILGLVITWQFDLKAVEKERQRQEKSLDKLMDYWRSK